VKYGEISRLAGAALSDEEVASYFAKLIMSCVVSVFCRWTNLLFKHLPFSLISHNEAMFSLSHKGKPREKSKSPELF
jgi:hypothetical protein